MVIFLIVISLLLILNVAAKRFIEKEIRNLEISAFTFSAPPKLNVSLLKREISVKQATLEREGTDSIYIQSIQIKGIHVFPLLFKGQMVVNKVLVDKPGVFLSKNSGRKPENDAKKKIRIKNWN